MLYIEGRSLLAGREFRELSLCLAGKRRHYLQPVEDDCRVTGCEDRSLMVKVLKAFVCGTTGSKPKLLTIDAERGGFYFGEDSWDSVFSPLLYDQSSLEAISVDCSQWGILNAVFTKIPHLLANSSTLRTLCFGFWGEDFRLSDAGVKAFSEGLVQTKCLRTLVLKDYASTQFVDVLTSAFTGNAQNTSLDEIDLPAKLERLGMVFEVLVSKYKNLKKIRLGLLITMFDKVPEYLVDNFQMVAECLRRWEQTPSDTRREVFLDISVYTENVCLSVEEEQGLLTCCDKWLSAKDGALLLGMRLELVYQNFSSEFRCPMWVHEIVRRSTQLDIKWFFDRDLDVIEEDFLLLCRSIQSNDTQESIDLALEGSEGQCNEGWPLIFQCLHHKRRLKTLRLGDDVMSSPSEVFRSLMDLLHVNIYLEEIDFGSDQSGDSDGRIVLVQEALRRNKEQSAYFATLRDAKLPFEEARAARVFLCGHPHAGKSTLRVTMMKTRHKESRIIKYWTRKLGPLWRKSGSGKDLQMKRTKGVDVELLRDDDQMQISVWDLAGQEIFRALQSLLLPAVTQGCVFVFVFSPFQDDQRHLKENLEDAFRLELRSWLHFIASHYPITGSFLPEVLVVISHKDKMKQDERDLGCEFSPIVDYFRAEYERALSLHGTPFHMDGWNEKEVGPFVDDLLVLVSEMLSKKTPEAPSVCCRLISEILNPQHPSSRQLTAQPVLRTPDFFTHISKRIGIRSFDQRVLEAVIRYMHDVGSVFYLPKCQLVIGDINWLTHKFLGLLVSEGHGFQVKSFSGDWSSEDGIVTKGTLDAILKKLSYTYRKKKVTVDRQFLQDLLVNLELCYPIGNVEGVDKYFMPTIFSRRNSRREDLSWSTASSSESKWQYFGYRLRCVDANTTSIPAATFPRFQIWFRKEIVTDDETCSLQRDVIRLDHNLDGYSIIMENAEEGAHVDVLFQFSGQKRRPEAMEYVREHVLQEFRKFCASPQGCRGVTFETAIIRPECVLRLTRQEYRKEQVVLERQLKDLFREVVEKKFNQGEVMGPRGDKGGDLDLFNYEHFWKGVPEAGLFKDSQQAIELLSVRDVEEIMEPIRQRIRVVVEQLTEVEQQLDSHLQQSVDGDESRLSADRYSWRSKGVSSGSTQEDNRFNELHEHLEYVKEHVEEHVDKAVASLSVQLQIIRKDIQQLQEQMHSTLLSIITKIDTMVGYSRALEDARVPRLAFITFTDVGFRQRMKSAVQIGTPVRLHLMCESRFRPHSVNGQPGLELSIGAENREWIRQISINALKVFWALLKAGVDSQLPGAGCFIPELGDLSSGLVPFDEMTLGELKESKLSSLPKVEGSKVAEDVWKFLRSTLPPATMPVDFKLQLVRYNPGTVAVDQSYAWLCQKCLDEGEKNHVLKCVGF